MLSGLLAEQARPPPVLPQFRRTTWCLEWRDLNPTTGAYVYSRRIAYDAILCLRISRMSINFARTSYRVSVGRRPRWTEIFCVRLGLQLGAGTGFRRAHLMGEGPTRMVHNKAHRCLEGADWSRLGSP